MNFKSIMLTVITVILSTSVHAANINIYASDTGSMSSSGGTWNDNLLRAYLGVDGFMKFDLSGISDNSIINSITLTTYHSSAFSNPVNDPQVAIYHVSNDSWSRGSNHPGLNEVLTSQQSGFPSNNYVPYDWSLDVSAFNWLADLTDNILSLSMRNEKTSYSYVYWHGSDSGIYAPMLSLEYSVVPVPAAVWFFGSGLLGLIGVARRKLRA